MSSVSITISPPATLVIIITIIIVAPNIMRNFGHHRHNHTQQAPHVCVLTRLVNVFTKPLIENVTT